MEIKGRACEAARRTAAKAEARNLGYEHGITRSSNGQI